MPLYKRCLHFIFFSLGARFLKREKLRDGRERAGGRNREREQRESESERKRERKREKK